jgi:hypothetical protein
MTYRPTFRKQGDGSRCQWQNCGPACQAMAADRHRKGVDPKTPHAWPPMPAEIRNFISPHTCAATSLTVNDAAATHMYATNMLVRYGIPWTTFRSLIISGRGAIVQISYSVIHGTKVDASPGFMGNHAIFVNERRGSDGAFYVYDPLADGRRPGIPKGPQWWAATLLQRAAYAMPGTAAGSVNASFTRDTEV